jgi:dienelactone hydrolase
MLSSWRPALTVVVLLGLAAPLTAEPLPDTQPLATEGDLAAQMVAGIDKYLMRELAASAEKRKEFWKIDASSLKANAESVEPNREHLRKILGVVDQRLPGKELEYVASTDQPSLVAETEGYKVYAVRWPALEGVEGDGLLVEPKGKPLAWVVALPDADQTPEMLVGLAPGVPEQAQFARRLAENHCRVLVPTLIDRKDEYSGNPTLLTDRKDEKTGKPILGRMTNQPHREFIYRMAYQMGRHILGYEIQKVLAAVDWFAQEKDHPPIGVVGYGEGGLVALLSGALDTRIHATVVSGYVGPRQDLWQEPIYRNVWGLLREFGAGELTLLFSPRRAITIEHADWPQVEGPPAPRQGRGGAAPGRLQTPDARVLFDELEGRKAYRSLAHVSARSGYGLWHGTEGYMATLISPNLDQLDNRSPQPSGKPPVDQRKGFDPAVRQKRQFDQLVAFTQKLMRDLEQNRAQTFWSKLDTSSVEKYQASTEPFRKQLWEEVLGKLPEPTEPINPRTKASYDEPKWRGYEVTLDLYPDVFAYGILLVPKDLKPGEKRPVVVCQHGLEGRPQDVVNPMKKTPYYNSFGAQLADRGYIVYAPQNPYFGQDKFRVLQRKANPLGLSLFSFIIRQHERTLDWLATLPFVDPERMAFYGLSYGGKTAMRVPAVLPRYCLSICSGDFNEWTWKNASVDYRNSYMFSGEYEMPEFNLGQTMVYAEMAALIAPRPFMVERGHDDPVGIDEWVAYEYAKVRRLYSRLKLPERTEIEFFAGGHEVHSAGTFAFLQKHLGYPK